MRHILLLVAGAALGYFGLPLEPDVPGEVVVHVLCAVLSGIFAPELAFGYVANAIIRHSDPMALELSGYPAAAAFVVRLAVNSPAGWSTRERLTHEFRLRAELSGRPGRPVETSVLLINAVSQLLIWVPLCGAIAAVSVDAIGGPLHPLLTVSVGGLTTTVCWAERARIRAMSRYDRRSYLLADIVLHLGLLTVVMLGERDDLPSGPYAHVLTAGSMMVMLLASSYLLAQPVRKAWPTAHMFGSFSTGTLLAYVCLVEPSPAAAWGSIATSLWALTVLIPQVRADASPLWWTRVVSAHGLRRHDRPYDAHVTEAWLHDEVRTPTGLALPHAMAAQAVDCLTRDDVSRHRQVRSPRAAAWLTEDDLFSAPSADRAINEGKAWLDAADDLIDTAEKYVSDGDVARARADCAFSRGQLLEAAADWTEAEATYRLAATTFATAKLPDFAALARLYRARVLAERLDRSAEAEAERKSIAADTGLLAPTRRWAGANLPADDDLLEYRRLERVADRPPIADLRAPAPPWRPLASTSPPITPSVADPRITLLQPVGDGPAKRIMDRGEQRWRRGRYSDAAQDLREAADLLERNSQQRAATKVLMELARLQTAADPRAAFETLEAALKLQERFREEADDQQLRLYVNGWFEALRNRQVALLVNASGTGWPERPAVAAFDLAEQSRSRLLLEQLADTAVLAAEGIPAVVARREREQLAAVRRWRSSMREPGEQVRALAELRTAHRLLASTWRALADTGARGAEYVQMRRGDPLKFAEVEPLLGQALLAEYHVTDDTVVLLLAASGAVEPTVVRVPMSRAELARALNGGYDATDATSSQGWDALTPLLDPLLRHSSPGQVIWIVPHDLLHGVPLHAFEVDGAPLISRNPVCYTPAATVMRYCQAKRQTTARKSVVLADSSAELPLPHSRAQSSLIGSLLDPSTRLVGASATATEMSAAMHGGVSVLHIACHGEFDAEQPARSHVILAQDGADDGLLTAERILGMALPADLVTLSACQSGLAQRRQGDELFGLTRALIYAGASAVLVSLWAVDEVATGLLMYSFYKARKAGESKAAALRTAQLAVRDATLEDVIAYGTRAGGDHRVLARMVADARFRARDFSAASRDYAELLDTSENGSADERELSAANARAKLALRGQPGKPDYSTTIYAHPYYWAGFVLIGDWH